MRDYRVFGGVLRSDLEFPALPLISGEAPSWVLHDVVGPVPGVHGECLGQDLVCGGVYVRLHRLGAGFRLVFDDTGCFDISADGRTLHWYHGADVSTANARVDLTARVLAAALHVTGSLCLHGSAVVLNGQAIGFVAPKLHGKSTLAMALVAAGARLLTDDTLPLIPGPPPSASPGLHATRIRADSAARVGLGEAPPGDSGEKRLFYGLPDERLMHDRCKVAAIYVLAPVRSSGQDEVAWRVRLSTKEAALALIGHAKLATLLGKSESAVLFQRAVRFAGEVPVYRLHVVRDLERLGEVTARIQAWHASRPVPAVTTGR